MNLIQNLIVTNVLIVMIYLVYKGAFSKSSFFQANRAFLVTGSFVALILPWISPVMGFLSPANDLQWMAAVPVVNDESLKLTGAVLAEPINSIRPRELALGAYLAAALAIAVICGFLWIRLLISIRKVPRHRYGKLKIVEIKNGWSAFSLFRTVFYPKPYEPDLPETKLILEHELVHARQMHTLDNIFLGALRLAFFFNPCIHLLHKELMITHEYLADRLTSGSDRTGYSRLLISHQFKVPRLILMHSFNQQSFLKRRLNMLSKNQPNQLAAWKYLLVLPLLGGMILGSSWSATAQDKNQKKKTETAAKVEKQLKKMGFVKTGESTWTKDGITVQAMDNVAMEEINARLKEAEEAKIQQQNEEEKQVFLIVEDMPTFQGGNIEDFRIWAQRNVKYPAEAKDKKISGTVYVSFVVNRKGEMVNINIVRGVNPLLDEEVIQAMKSAPAWTPGKQRGQPVNVSFAIPVKFVLDSAGDQSPKDSLILKPKSGNTHFVEGESKKSPEKQVFMVVEEMPVFQGGGIEKFISWIYDNVKYPREAMEKSISGTVEVSFIVNEKGQVEDAQITKSAHPVLDEAAVAAVKSSPEWRPGKQRGQYVKVSFNIPIKFTLN